MVPPWITGMHPVSSSRTRLSAPYFPAFPAHASDWAESALSLIPYAIFATCDFVATLVATMSEGGDRLTAFRALSKCPGKRCA